MNAATRQKVQEMDVRLGGAEAWRTGADKRFDALDHHLDRIDDKLDQALERSSH